MAYSARTGKRKSGASRPARRRRTARPWVEVLEDRTLLSSGPGSLSGLFGPPTNFEVGRHPSSVALADLNGDRKLDLVVGNEGTNSFSVLLGNGDGTVQTQVTYATGTAVAAVALGDFNGDHQLDAAVANYGHFYDGAYSPDSVGIFLGHGDGTFDGLPADGGNVMDPAHAFPTGGNDPVILATGDFNGDGKLDLAAANYHYAYTGADATHPNGDGRANVGVLLGHGDGTFAAPITLDTQDPPNSVAVGDFNGDGRLDLAASVEDYAGHGGIQVFQGNGDGTFGAPLAYQGGSSPNTVAVADVNEDGLPDIVTAPASHTLDAVDVLPNTSANSVIAFGAPLTSRVSEQNPSFNDPARVLLADLNGDGHLDVAVNYYHNQDLISVAAGNGDGTFGSPTDFAIGQGYKPWYVAAGDVNGDGFLDLAVANVFGTNPPPENSGSPDNNVSVLLNQAGLQNGGAGGALVLNVPDTGTIDAANAANTWSFVGQAGQTVAVVVNPGDPAQQPVPPAPVLHAAAVQVLDPIGQVVAAGQSAVPDAAVILPAVTLPAAGISHVVVTPPAGAASSTGNYTIALYDASITTRPLTLNQAVAGQLNNLYVTDRWTFQGQANQQVVFRLAATSGRSFTYDLAGPGGYAGFTGLTDDSSTLTLPTDGTYVVTVHRTGAFPGTYSFALEAAALVVTNTNASGDGSLAAAVALDNTLLVPVPITFAAGLAGTIVLDGTLALSNTRSTAAHPEEIDGPGAGSIVITGATAADRLAVDFSVTTRLSGITLNGFAYQFGNLTAEGCTFDLAAGTALAIAAGAFAGDTFQLEPGAALGIANGNFTGVTTVTVAAGGVATLTGGQYAGTLTGAGDGTVQITGGRLFLGTGGLTLNFPGSLLQWTGGVIDAGNGDLVNLGTVTLAGANPKAFFNDGLFDNFGTIIHTGTGFFLLGTDNLFPVTLKIEAGASYLLQSDAGIGQVQDHRGIAGFPTLINAGTFRKAAGSAPSTVTLDGSITNTGTIEADAGALTLRAGRLAQVSGTTLTGGTWVARNGATLGLALGIITGNQGNIILAGPGATVGGLTSLASNSGQLSLLDGATLSTTAALVNSGTVTLGAGSTLQVAGKFTQAAGGTLQVQLGGMPENGQFGRLAATGMATLAGTLGVALVNGFTPRAGQDFPVLGYAGATGSFTTLTGLSPFFTQVQGATSLDLIDPSVNAVNLVLNRVTAPDAAAPGQTITVSWQVADPGSVAAAGSWQDSVYLSSTPALGAGALLLGKTIHRGGLAAGSSYDGSWTGAVPALPPGNYYVLVQVDSLYQVPQTGRAANVLAGPAPLRLSVPALTLGTPYADTFTADIQDRYYQVTVAAGTSLLVAVSNSLASETNAIYARLDSLPTTYQFDVQSPAPAGPNPSLVLPLTQAGTYYVLVHNRAGDPGAFTITASRPGLTLLHTAPGTVGNAGQATFAVDGLDLGPDTAYTLAGPGGMLAAVATEPGDAARAFVTFDLTGAAPGAYDLRAARAGGVTATLAGAVQVAAGGGANVVASVLGNTPVRLGRTSVFYLQYANLGTNDAPAPLLTLRSPSQTLMGLDPNQAPSAMSLEVLGVSQTGPAGVLRPGASFQVPIYYRPTTVGSFSFNVQVNDSADINPLDGRVILALVPASVQNAANWPAVYAQLQQQLGNTWGQYIAALDRDATLLPASLGSAADPSDLLQIDVARAVAAVGTSLSGVAAATGPGVILAGNTITATNTTTGDVFIATILNDGSFVFPTVTPGSYTFSVPGALVDGAAAPVAVAADQAVTGAAVPLAPAVILTGQITAAATGAPIAGALVLVTAGTDTIVATLTTDAAGGYRTALVPGSYTLVVVAPGLARSYADATFAPGPARLNVALAAESAVTGSVSLSDGQPVTEVRVIAALHGDQPVPFLAHTFDTATFRLGMLPAGVYDILVFVPGYDPVTLNDVTVGPGQTTPLGALVLTPPDPVAPILLALKGYSQLTLQGIFRLLGGSDSLDILNLYFNGPGATNDPVADSSVPNPAVFITDPKDVGLFRDAPQTRNALQVTLREIAQRITNLPEVQQAIAQLKDCDAGAQTIPLNVRDVMSRLGLGGFMDVNPDNSPGTALDLWKYGGGIPGLLAGGVGKGGPPPAAAVPSLDSRSLSGSLSLTISPDGSALLEGDFFVAIHDTFDFAGDVGYGPLINVNAPLPTLTNPFSSIDRSQLGNVLGADLTFAAVVALNMLESYGLTADVPFDVSFPAAPVGYAFDVPTPDKDDCDKPKPENPPKGGKPGPGGSKPGGGSGGGGSGSGGSGSGGTGSAPPVLVGGGGDTFAGKAVGSLDPNAMLGPAGYGPQNFLPPAGTWPYTVAFENEGDAAAQVVTVTQQLDPGLDWSTFQLGSFGWGPVNVVVPAGLTQYQATVGYQNADGTPLNVLVSLDFNVKTGLLTASFTSLDPATSQAPAGAFDGFLYTEDGSGAGQGFVQYTVQPRGDLATGTVIAQQASVIFDTNDPLATAAFDTTIDAGAPTSAVLPLPTSENALGFTVAWSGQDDAGGSGIATYSVYVSDDGGTFAPLLLDTTQTATTFTGQPGHTYAFVTIAADNVGNVEFKPAEGDASTKVVLAPDITWANPADISYGTALGAAQLDATATVVIGGATQAVPGTFHYTLADGTTAAAGAVLHAGQGQILNVTFTPTDTNGYASTSAQATINVTPVSLQISADSKSKLYGAPLPALTASYQGFVNGDTSASLTTAPTLTTSATSSSPPGNYAINVSGAVDPDYQISYVPGTLTIQPAGSQTLTTALLLQLLASHPAALSFSAAPGQLAADVSAIAGLPSQAAFPVTITLNLGAGTYPGLVVTPPAGVTLVLHGAGPATVLVGQSPALTVTAGSVQVQDVTLTSSTAAPTVLVQGGSLTLQGDTIQESAAAQAAVKVTGGALDLGNGVGGGNTLTINPAGWFVINTGPNLVTAIGNTFQVTGRGTLADPYQIAARILDALDGGGGLVVFVAQNVYVTAGSAGIQQAVNAVPAGYIVNVQAGTHFADYTAGAKLITLSFQNGPRLQLSADSLFAAGATTLRVTGGPQDSTHIAFQSVRGGIKAAIDGYPAGTFSPSGGIVAHGGGGKQAHLDVSPAITLPALLFADGSNAHVEGGGGPTVEVGGGGSDTHLEGGKGRNILIAGAGAAHLDGKSDQDILIGGSTAFDADEARLAALLAEWTRSYASNVLTDYLARVGHITGTLTGGKNVVGGIPVVLTNLLLAKSPTVTDNGKADHLEGGSGFDLVFAGLGDHLDGVALGDVVLPIR